MDNEKEIEKRSFVHHSAASRRTSRIFSVGNRQFATTSNKITTHSIKVGGHYTSVAGGKTHPTVKVSNYGYVSDPIESHSKTTSRRTCRTYWISHASASEKKRTCYTTKWTTRWKSTLKTKHKTTTWTTSKTTHRSSCFFPASAPPSCRDKPYTTRWSTSKSTTY